MPENRQYYAWVGQNASTGTPNPITGGMSMYGTNHVFVSKKERDEFVNGYRSDNPSKQCIACSLRGLRRRNLGCSVRAFGQDLQTIKGETE